MGRLAVALVLLSSGVPTLADTPAPLEAIVRSVEQRDQVFAETEQLWVNHSQEATSRYFYSSYSRGHVFSEWRGDATGLCAKDPCPHCFLRQWYMVLPDNQCIRGYEACTHLVLDEATPVAFAPRYLGFGELHDVPPSGLADWFRQEWSWSSVEADGGNLRVRGTRTVLDQDVTWVFVLDSDDKLIESYEETYPPALNGRPIRGHVINVTYQGDLPVKVEWTRLRTYIDAQDDGTYLPGREEIASTYQTAEILWHQPRTDPLFAVSPYEIFSPVVGTWLGDVATGSSLRWDGQTFVTSQDFEARMTAGELNLSQFNEAESNDHGDGPRFTADKWEQFAARARGNPSAWKDFAFAVVQVKALAKEETQAVMRKYAQAKTAVAAGMSVEAAFDAHLYVAWNAKP